MATRRRYTAKQRAAAVGIAVAEGVTEAERQIGIPKETIHYWTHKPEFAHLRTTAHEVVVESFYVGVQVGLEEVTKGLRDPKVPLKDKAHALRVVAERYALLTGQATSRSETRDLTNTMDDHERDLLAKVLRDAVEEPAGAGD